MAWKGNILKWKGLRTCVELFQNSTFTSSNITVNAKHMKISVRTRTSGNHNLSEHRQLPSLCSISIREGVDRGHCVNVTGLKNYQSLLASFRREFSTESGEPIEKKSQAQARTVVTYEELKDLMSKHEILLVDVRDPKEIEQTGLMPGAVNIPLTKLKNSLTMDAEGFQSTYGKSKPLSSGDNLVFYGLSNIKSEAALELAHKAGYKKARHYSGGWQEWSEKETGL